MLEKDGRETLHYNRGAFFTASDIPNWDYSMTSYPQKCLVFKNMGKKAITGNNSFCLHLTAIKLHYFTLISMK